MADTKATSIHSIRTEGWTTTLVITFFFIDYAFTFRAQIAMFLKNVSLASGSE